MKIGIMTFWWSQDNYGQLLQCYALQRYLRDAGHDVYLIRYDPGNDCIRTPIWKRLIKALNPVELYNYVLLTLKHYTAKTNNKKHPRHFNDFRNKYIHQTNETYRSYAELLRNPPDADIYIAGSDQIWNFFYAPLYNVRNIINAYLLNFGSDKTKRIAYAASFGIEKADAGYLDIMEPLMQKFGRISVREKTGVTICRQCGIDTAEWVIDPTMLLTGNRYRALYAGVPEKNIAYYCFLYLLGNRFDFPVKKIYEWASKTNKKIILVTGNNLLTIHETQYPAIEEWLYLVDHAEYVITNSFHCCVFSILFKKQFAVIPLHKKDAGMNSRFYSLFETAGIADRFLSKDNFEIFDENIDYQKVETLIEQRRLESGRYLTDMAGEKT